MRYALQSAKGVAEVASVGGFVREYQIDVDPDALRVHGVSLTDLFRAVQRSNVDVGARSIEVNQVECQPFFGPFEGQNSIARDQPPVGRSKLRDEGVRNQQRHSRQPATYSPDRQT